MAEPDFWTNKERAQKQVEEVSSLRGKITPLLALERQIEDLPVLIELALEARDAASAAEVELGVAAREAGISRHPTNLRRFRFVNGFLRRVEDRPPPCHRGGRRLDRPRSG